MYILLLGSKCGDRPKISFLGAPEVGTKKYMERERRESEEQKSVLTMAS